MRLGLGALKRTLFSGWKYSSSSKRHAKVPYGGCGPVTASPSTDMISIQNIWSLRSSRKPCDCAAGMKTAVSFAIEWLPASAWKICVLSAGMDAAGEGR